jgi:hypothetical protein
MVEAINPYSNDKTEKKLGDLTQSEEQSHLKCRCMQQGNRCQWKRKGRDRRSKEGDGPTSPELDKIVLLPKVHYNR